MNDKLANTPPTLSDKSDTKTASTLIIETAEITEENTKALSEPTDKYSDYEITIEESTHYEDALFNSEDELDLAITQGIKKIEEKEKNDSNKDSSKKSEEKSKKTVTVTPIVLSNNISPYTQEKKFKAGIHLFSKETTSLPTSNPPTIDKQILPTQQAQPEENFISKLPVASCQELPSNLQPLKNKLLKAKILARYKLDKILTAFNIYFGRSLPARDIDLDFKALKLKAKKDLGPILSNHECANLFATKGIRQEQLFLEISEQLSKLEKCALSNRDKQKRASLYCQLILPHLQTANQTFLKRPVSAKNSHYADIAESLKFICKHIITLYKQLYMPLYQSSNFIYGPQRNKANLLAFKLIEWLCMEQSISNATLSPIPSHSIKTFNSLFFALASYEPEFINKKIQSINSKKPKSIIELYKRYQLLLIINFKQINSRFQNKIIDIIDDNLHLASLYSVRGDQQQNCLFIDYNSTTEMKFTTVDKIQSRQGMALDLGNFTNSIEQEFHQLLAQLGSSNKTTADKVQSDYSCFLAIYEQLSNYSHDKITQRYSIYQDSKLLIYSGLASIYNLSLHLYAHNAKQCQIDTLDIELPEPPKPAQAKCSVALNNSKSLFLQTNESKAAINLNIGEPIIISEKLDETAKLHSYLAIVNGLERTQNHLINIELGKLALDYTGVVLVATAAPNNKALVYRKAKQSYLLCNSTEICWKGKTMEVLLHDNSAWVLCIKSLDRNFGQYCIYELF